ncbi:MAG TPA: phage terminase large subunit [Candidatus Sumerlaeota bacterium]|nr:phage terminase large subunit [Candidatus Sumerlaeota bacterium]HON50690.1 phage terminase large subunit [Candidatus Sumerlaeota bacterium]HOR65192.1 phage terminase large subunit [Candidatus Sumerlaeota bacterium]HRR30358.1 phage terminase large subunit [Candidatus Sumerlaeia bacterium]
MRCRTDPLLFARYFFPHHCRLPFSSMHRDFFEKYRRRLIPDILARKGWREAIAAPRGFAKSTIKTLILPIHAILYNYERYIIIISATLRQAKQRLKNIKNEFLTNKLLRDYYNISIGSDRRRSWTQQTINLLDCQAEAYSAGTEIRGISWREFRPTRIILDDAEDSALVESAEGRAKILDWFNEVIEHLGDSYTIIEAIGTLLHPDSLLANLLRRPDFEARTFRAVLTFADDAALWEKWRLLFANLADYNRLETSRQFFLKNRNAMLKGSRVLWAAKEDYYSLMSQLATQGRRAFYQEKQNEPDAAESRIFDRKKFRYFILEGDKLLIEQPGDAPRTIPLASLSIFGFLDSALGNRKTSQSDFAAIATVGIDKDGFIYLLDVWMRRVPPTRQIEKIFELHERFKYDRFGIEANCFQSLLMLPLEEERKRRRAAGGIWDVPVIEIVQHNKKEARLLALEPFASNGWLLFNRAMTEEFLAQMEDIPHGRHDDGPDAVASVVVLCRGIKADGKAQNKNSADCVRAAHKSLALY